MPVARRNNMKAKLNFESLSKKGTIITVQTATNDAGKTNDPSGWWGPRTNEIPARHIPVLVFKKLLKNCEYTVINGGYADRKLTSTITKIEIR